MRKIKRFFIIALTLLLVTILLPLGNFKAQAEEGDDEPEVLGKTYKVGEIIKFGKYEQDGNRENGKEDVEWQVLKVESNRILVISKYVLDCWSYHNQSTDVTWESCNLRKRLNNDFLYAIAPDSNTQRKILTVTIKNENNSYHGTSGGNNTQDKIFCLSESEVKSLIGYSYYDDNAKKGYNQNLIVEPTQYAINQGASVYTVTEQEYNTNLKDKGYTADIIGRKGSRWWLRSPGYDTKSACVVFGDGRFGESVSNRATIGYIAIRPAFYLDTSVIYPTSIEFSTHAAESYFGEEWVLTPLLTPSNVTEKELTWKSSDESIATVSNGYGVNGNVKVKNKAGVTTISATTVNGLTAKYEVTVFADNVYDNIFADVKKYTWMYEPAKAVYQKGYMTGIGTLKGNYGNRVLFSPNTDMNRTMFVQSLYSKEGKPEVAYAQKFSDVTESAWYAKAVTWASNNGIVAGNPDGTFSINGKATREQMALMLYKYAVYKNYDVSINDPTTLNNFTDAGKASSWAVTAIKWAVERGIISGKGNAQSGYRIAPTEKATRIECAAMMNKFSEIYASAPKMGDEDLEEPLALPEEDMEEVPIPADETEDVIIDEDESEDENVPSKDEEEVDEESDSEEVVVNPEE